MKKLIPLTLTSLLLTVAVQAQTTKPPQIRLDWPRTFTGQPDFEFERAEVLKERTLESNRQGKTKPVPPTLADLIEDDSPEPIELIGLSVADTSSATEVEDTTFNIGGYSLSVSNLPSLTVAGSVNLVEFKKSLEQAIRYAVMDFKPNFQIYALDYVLRGLSLNGVVSSPVKYCVINGQRYEVGDRFQVKVSIGPTDAEVLEAMQTRMPNADSLPKEMYSAYQEAYEEMVTRLADDKGKNPGKYMRTFTLPVTIHDIQDRKVVIEFQGRYHELKVTTAL